MKYVSQTKVKVKVYFWDTDSLQSVDIRKFVCKKENSLRVGVAKILPTMPEITQIL